MIGWHLASGACCVHVDAGNLEVKERYGCVVLGPEVEANQIPGLDTAIADGDVLDIAGVQAQASVAGQCCCSRPTCTP